MHNALSDNKHIKTNALTWILPDSRIIIPGEITGISSLIDADILSSQLKCQLWWPK